MGADQKKEPDGAVKRRMAGGEDRFSFLKKNRGSRGPPGLVISQGRIGEERPPSFKKGEKKRTSQEKTRPEKKGWKNQPGLASQGLSLAKKHQQGKEGEGKNRSMCKREEKGRSQMPTIETFPRCPAKPPPTPIWSVREKRGGHDRT